MDFDAASNSKVVDRYEVGKDPTNRNLDAIASTANGETIKAMAEIDDEVHDAPIVLEAASETC